MRDVEGMDTQRVAALRARLRRLIDAEMPDWYRNPFHDEGSIDATQRFCRVLAREGLLALDWPAEWGGATASVWEQTAFREEMWAHDEPRGAQYMGLSWVGPTIIRHGTDAQKAQHLPSIARGEVTWCQGFSEPDAGSDLASLQLAATPDGDGWRLDGQKIWTSYATIAQWCFLAARTGTREARHRGITIFLVPLDRPGLEVRPIASMMGQHHLNEVFFDQVPVSRDDVLGEVDGGWDVIASVLAFERVGIPRYARSDRLLEQLWPHLAGLSDDAPARLDHARAAVHCRVARMLAYRVLENGQRAGALASHDPPLQRIASTLLDQEVAELAMEAVGPAGLDDAGGPLDGRAEDHWRYARASTVAAGTTEIQRLIVGRALGRGEALTHSDHRWPSEAQSFAEATRAALAKLGGVDLARKAERDPEIRRGELEPVLSGLGFLDIAPVHGRVETMAVTMAIREAGAVVCPWPLIQTCACDVEDSDALYLGSVDVDRLEHLDLVDSAVVAGADGELTVVAAAAPLAATPLDPFGVPVRVTRRLEAQPGVGSYASLLTSYWILGALTTVTELAVAYGRDRAQFGRPIGEFGAVRWRLSEMAMFRAGLEELAWYTLGRHLDDAATEADILALRVYALEAASVVLTHGHQVFAAVGLCDEHDLSIIDRHLQPLLRRPGGRLAAETGLSSRITTEGFDALFAIAPAVKELA